MSLLSNAQSPLTAQRTILDHTFTESSQVGSDSSSISLTDPIPLDDEQKELFRRYCHLRREDRFLSLRDADLSEQLHVMSDTLEPVPGLTGRVRGWLARQHVNSIREARESLTSQRRNSFRRLKKLEAHVRNSSGAEMMHKFRSMSQTKLEAFIEPKRRNSEIRLEELRAQQQQRMPFQVTNVVVNLSQRQLSCVEERVLSYGLQMSWPQYVNSMMVRVETEAMYDKLRRREKVVREARTIVKALMRRAMRRWSLTNYKNITKEMEVLRKLASVGHLQFCAPFGGGPKVVVMDSADYSARMHDWLTRHPSIFRHLGPALESGKKCPLVEQEEHFHAQLEAMRCEKIITRAQFYQFRCPGGLPPRLVGQPDLRHNPTEPPLRPLILMQDSCMATLAAWLSCELRQLLCRNIYVDDATVLRSRLEDGALRVAFADKAQQRPIVALLHGVNPKITLPLSATQRHIHHLIASSPQADLNSGTFERLTRLCCENILCMFEGDVYRLMNESVPFDSPLSDILVSFAFDLVDSKWSNSAISARPKFFLRHGDTALAVFKTASHAQTFLTFCNCVNPAIQQELEIAENEQVTFLDLLIDFRPLPYRPVRTVWPSKCLTGAAALHIPSVSFVPYDEKMAAMRESFAKCRILTSSEEDSEHGLQQLQEAFRLNGFAAGDINRAMGEPPKAVLKVKETTTDDRTRVIWRLPFTPAIHQSIVRGVHDINRFLKKSKVILELNFLRSSSVLPAQEPVPDLLCGQMVFTLRCSNCGATSLHDTDRHLVEVISSRQKRHHCRDEKIDVEGPNGGEGESRYRGQLVPKVIMRSAHHKLAKAVMDEAAGKRRRKHGHVRLRFPERRMEKMEKPEKTEKKV